MQTSVIYIIALFDELAWFRLPYCYYHTSNQT